MKKQVITQLNQRYVYYLMAEIVSKCTEGFILLLMKFARLVLWENRNIFTTVCQSPYQGSDVTINAMKLSLNLESKTYNFI